MLAFLELKGNRCRSNFWGCFGRLSAAAFQRFLKLLDRSCITPRQRSSVLIPPTTPPVQPLKIFRRLTSRRRKSRNRHSGERELYRCWLIVYWKKRPNWNWKPQLQFLNKHRSQPPGGYGDIAVSFEFVNQRYESYRRRKRHLVRSFHDSCLFILFQILPRPLPGDHLTFRVDSLLVAGWEEGSPLWILGAAEAEESALQGGLAENCWSRTSPDGKQLC